MRKKGLLGLSKELRPSGNGSHTPVGQVGYDNPRENIDPHLKSKVISVIEIDGQKLIRNIDGNQKNITNLNLISGSNLNINQLADIRQISGVNCYIKTISGASLYISGNCLVVNGGTGYVGIGTASPAQKLDVNGKANIDGLMVGSATYNGAYGTLEIQNTASDASLCIIEDGGRRFTIQSGWGATLLQSAGSLGLGVGSVGLHMDASNKVGIGTTVPNDILTISSPLTTLNSENPIIISQVPGYARTGGIYNTIDNWVDGLGTGMLFKTYKQGIGSYNAIKIRHDGNVGIGTTTPGDKLHISGGRLVISNYPGDPTALANGGITFVSGGALWFKGSAGTLTNIAIA